MRAVLPALCLVLLAASCGTPEYRAERSVCEAEWQAKIPPQYERQLVERVRHIQVPTGVSTCTTVNNVQRCVSQMRTEMIPYTTVETVDVNAPRRDVQVAACAAKACQAKFGNAECKPAG